MGNPHVRVDYENLAARINANEEGAFKEFARLFGPSFRWYFRRCGMPPVEADDEGATLVTDVLLKVGLYTPTQPAGFRAWVFTIMRHRAADWGRRQAREKVAMRQLAAADCPAPSALAPEEILAVAEAWPRLSEPDREILALRHFRHEPKWTDIATELGISEGAARVRHMRAWRRLERLLRNDPRIKRLTIRGKKQQKEIRQYVKQRTCEW